MTKYMLIVVHNDVISANPLNNQSINETLTEILLLYVNRTTDVNYMAFGAI